MTARFLSPLRLEYAADGSGRKVTTAPLFYQSDILGRVIEVPAGFETDLASVPRLPLAFLLFGAIADEAAVVHDYLYVSRIVDRKTADEVFAEAMKASGVAAWRRFPMWAGVRLFGGAYWSESEQQDNIYFG